MHSSPAPLPLHGQRPRHRRQLALALLLSAGPAFAALQARANPADPACTAPQPGRYAVMGEGDLMGEPLARLLLETWNPDGTLQGVRLERRGRIYRESTYTGRFRPITNCRVAIERSYLNMVSTSQAVLDLQGRPRFSLGILPDVLMVMSVPSDDGIILDSSDISSLNEVHIVASDVTPLRCVMGKSSVCLRRCVTGNVSVDATRLSVRPRALCCVVSSS